MQAFNQFISWYFKRRYPEIESWANLAEQKQEQVWQQLLQSAKNTAWGRYYGYASMKTIADYQKNVPIQTYDSLKPFIHRMLEGDKNVLWHSSVDWFAKSSGWHVWLHSFEPSAVLQDATDVFVSLASRMIKGIQATANLFV